MALQKPIWIYVNFTSKFICFYYTSSKSHDLLNKSDHLEYKNWDSHGIQGPLSLYIFWHTGHEDTKTMVDGVSNSEDQPNNILI